MNQERKHYDQVGWPPLEMGPNEAGPTDRAGEYGAVNQALPVEPAARIPGQVRETEQPIDVASQTNIPPPIDEDVLSSAERGFGDLRHIARGKPSMSSS